MIETSQSQTILDTAVFRRTKETREYVGYWLSKNCDKDRLTPEQLATKLGLDLHNLARLALCTTPNPDPEKFYGDIVAVSALVGLDAKKLVFLLRNMWAIEPWEPQSAQKPDLKGGNTTTSVPVDEPTPRPKAVQQPKIHGKTTP